MCNDVTRKRIYRLPIDKNFLFTSVEITCHSKSVNHSTSLLEGKSSFKALLAPNNHSLNWCYYLIQNKTFWWICTQSLYNDTSLLYNIICCFHNVFWSLRALYIIRTSLFQRKIHRYKYCKCSFFVQAQKLSFIAPNSYSYTSWRHT